MKKVILYCMLICGSSFPVGGYASVLPSAIAVADYCPEGYVCEATNLTAIKIGLPGDRISGVVVYKDSKGNYIANIPGHGNLRAYPINGGSSLSVYINDATYNIDAPSGRKW